MKTSKLLLLLVSVGFLLIYSYFSPKFQENKQNTSQSVVPSKSSQDVLSADTSFADNEYIVASVYDGDTIETKEKIKIRLLGVNTAEIGQPYAEEARDFNRSLVLGKKVRLQYDVQQKDRYGRILAYVFVDNMFVNLELVKNGFAVSETIQPNVKYQQEIIEAQKQARNACLNIWEGLCSTPTNKENCVKITTIHYDAEGNEADNKNDEWISLQNSCSTTVYLEGWLIKDNSASNSYTFPTFSLPANKTVVIHSGCGNNTQTDLYWKCPEQKNAIWNNDSDHAFLYNQSKILVSDYSY